MRDTRDLRIKLGIFVTHPIQYQAPLWRELSRFSELDVTVHYFSDQGVANRLDPGFAKVFAWDVPLLEGYHYKFLSQKPIRYAPMFRIHSVRRFLEESHFQVVFLHGYAHLFSIQLVLMARRFNYKVILRGEFTERKRDSNMWRRVLRPIYLKWFYSKVDHFCPIGKDSMEHLQIYGVPESKITLTPYSVDDELLARQREAFDRKECRRFFGIGEDQIVFLFSGKMIERKQPLLLAQAALKLKENPRLFLIFLGDGEQLPILRRVLEKELGGRFICPGFVNQSQLGRFFSAADVFVLPSKFETWGLVVNEAMHFGLPCIVSDGASCSQDLIIHGKTGFVFPSGDEEALVNVMRYFLKYPEEIRTIGVAAFDHIKNFTTKRTASAIRDAVIKTCGA
ncbi:MAG: glycosyltransferase family 4 protein [Deltaproteobacteria bacterium]|nr:glycosyltransferase family 4 protein [Deltaproteobacteria bacterium]